MPRFCMVTTFYPPYHFGGDGVFVYRLAHALAGRGHDVDVIHSEDAYRIAHPDDPPVAYEEHPRVTRHALRSSRPSLAALWMHQTGRPDSRLRELLEDRGYDVIHYHNVSLLGAPGLLRLGRALKLYTTHEYWLVCPTHVLFRFQREACTRRTCLACTLHHRRPPQLWRYLGSMARGLEAVDHVLAPSRFARMRHIEDGVRRPVTVLPHFVPGAGGGEALVEGASPAAGASRAEGARAGAVGSPPGQGRRAGASGPGGGASTPDAGAPRRAADRPYFLFVGRLEKLKGLQDVLAVFRDFRAADLVVVGNGDFEPELRAQASGLQHVRFVGTVHPSELAAYYRGARAVLAPSLCYETFGLTAAEGMSHGTPAVVRRIGALGEVVEESGGGVAFATTEELGAALGRMLEDEGWRDGLARAGRAYAAEHWSVDAHLDRYLAHVESWR